MNRRIWMVVLMAGIAYGASAQNYRAIDSSMKVLKAGNIDQLTKTIQARYPTPRERVRAVFSWMAFHIDYDVQGFYKTGNLYSPQWPAMVRDSAQREKQFREQVAERVFRERKGICAGYSKLFMTLCDKLGIASRSVEGVGKVSIGKTTDKFRSNHEWNLVFIDGKWQPVDVTWAAGTTDFGKGKFNRDFNDHYFLTDPGLLLVDHYPAKSSDALLSWVPSYTQFITKPMVYRDFWLLHPTDFSASSGYLKSSDSAITLSFHTDIPVTRFQMMVGNSGKAELIDPEAGKTVYNGKNFVYQSRANKYKLRFSPVKRGGGKIIVFINGRAVMEFLQST